VAQVRQLRQAVAQTLRHTAGGLASQILQELEAGHEFAKTTAGRVAHGSLLV